MLDPGTYAAMMEGPEQSFFRHHLSPEKTTFRQIGWLISGGPHDAEFIPWPGNPIEMFKGKPIGYFSPVYIEVGE